MPHVLIAHENIRVRTLLRRLFEQKQYPMDIAASPAEALAVASHYSPDAAILHTTYASMSGFDLADKLRVLYPNLPILLWALRISKEQRAQANSMQVLIVEAWPTQHDFYSGLNWLLELL